MYRRSAFLADYNWGTYLNDSPTSEATGKQRSSLRPPQLKFFDLLLRTHLFPAHTKLPKAGIGPTQPVIASTRPAQEPISIKLTPTPWDTLHKKSHHGTQHASQKEIQGPTPGIRRLNHGGHQGRWQANPTSAPHHMTGTEL